MLPLPVCKLRHGEESQSELPHLQLALVETERKRQALQEEIKVAARVTKQAFHFRCFESVQAHENDAAACKSALQTAQAIRSDETQTYRKELNFRHSVSLGRGWRRFGIYGRSLPLSQPTSSDWKNCYRHRTALESLSLVEWWSAWTALRACSSRFRVG